MKFVSLVSGGKDSIFATKCLIDQGNELVAILNMEYTDEYTDSYMYQTVGSEVVKLFGECLNVPLFTYKTRCISKNRDLEYEINEGDEIEDLYNALKDIKNEKHFDAICSGAIFSTYQKNRVENVARRLDVESVAPLWHRDQKLLLKEMIDTGIKAILVKISSSILDLSYLGKDLKYLYDSNVMIDNHCGEGGEYETIVLDCPLFVKAITYKEATINDHPEEVVGEKTVFYLKFIGVHAIQK